MLKAYEYRMYPEEDQEVLIGKHFGSSRYIFNWALGLKSLAWNRGKINLSKFDLMNELPSMKVIHPWLKEVNSQTLQSSIKYMDIAFKNFFSGSGFPKFRKRSHKDSYEIPQEVKVDFGKCTIRLPKFKKPIRAVFHKKFEGTIKTCTMKQSASGKYFISILVEDGKELPSKKIPNNIGGVDLGSKDFLTSSKGLKIPNPKYYRKFEAQLKRQQRKFSRKVKGSKNKEKQRIRVAVLQEKIKISRKFFHHEASNRLIHENQVDTICMEDLNVSGMVRNHKLAKTISDAGWSEFVRIVKYKCDWEGLNFLQADRFFPSSKRCSECGFLYKDLQLSERFWTCPSCGSYHDREENAANNLEMEGKRILGFPVSFNKVGWSPPEPDEAEGLSLTPVETDMSLSEKQESDIVLSPL